MSTIHQPHDKLVSKLLEDKSIAIELFKNHLPAQYLEKLSLHTLKPSSETAVSRDWKKYHNDIVFQCKTKDNNQAYLYLLIEHQSTPDPFMPIRLLRYKLNILGKYMDSSKRPKKLPNVIGLVIYHGKREYPFPQDVPSCFEDPALATAELMKPMLVVDLAAMPEDVLLQHHSADTLLKILLKLSRQKDFIRKVEQLISMQPQIFLSLSSTQAGFVFEYVLRVGKGNPQNAKIMKTAMNQLYGEKKASKVFTLMDYFREEAIQMAKVKGERIGKKIGKKIGEKAGKKIGKEIGEKIGRQEGINLLVKEGYITQEVAQAMIKKAALL